MYLPPLRYHKQIFVNTLSGRTITIEVNDGELLESVQLKIQAKENVPPDEQILTYENRDLLELLLSQLKTGLVYGIQVKVSIHYLFLSLEGRKEGSTDEILEGTNRSSLLYYR